MNKKEIVNKILEGFCERNPDKVLPYVSDDISWDINNHHVAVNKEECAKQVVDPDSAGKPVIKINNMIEENDLVAVQGECECEMKEVGLIQVNFFDLYRFENGKVKEMRAYVIEKKK